MPSTENVRAASLGNELWSEISNRYVTVPALPVTAALETTSVGRGVSTMAPPIGDCGVGAPSVTGVVGAAARCVIVIVVPATAIVPVRSAPELAATVNCTVPLAVP